MQNLEVKKFDARYCEYFLKSAIICISQSKTTSKRLITESVIPVVKIPFKVGIASIGNLSHFCK